MRLVLKREIFGETYTIGKLYIDFQNNEGPKYLCDTLEDKVRDIKIYGETAIPSGIYRVTNTFSQKFQRIMPYINNVKGFTGVRIHAGNSISDTFGCILTGTAQGSKLINSTLAYNRLWSIVKNYKQGYDLEIS
jgi:hypothetical protein